MAALWDAIKADSPWLTAMLLTAVIVMGILEYLDRRGLNKKDS